MTRRASAPAQQPDGDERETDDGEQADRFRGHAPMIRGAPGDARPACVTPPASGILWAMTRRRRNVLVVLLALVALLGGGALAVRERFNSEGAVDPSVASIEREAGYQDPALLAQAWQLPVAQRYGPGGIDYQKNNSFCGPTSIVNVERSLGGADDQGHVLDGTGQRTIFGILPHGLTLDEEAAIARLRTGRNVTVLRDQSLDEFRAELTHANDPARRYIVNFSRRALFGRGGGHHSPIGGYLADRDLVLVVDVNARFHPWLVATERLWRAAHTTDSSTGRSRGLLRIE